MPYGTMRSPDKGNFHLILDLIHSFLGLMSMTLSSCHGIASIYIGDRLYKIVFLYSADA